MTADKLTAEVKKDLQAQVDVGVSIPPVAFAYCDRHPQELLEYDRSGMSITEMADLVVSLCSALITSARVTPAAGIFDPPPGVFGTINGREQLLFTFYPDELTFTPAEFVGLSVQEARALRHKKDVAYLQSPDAPRPRSR